MSHEKRFGAGEVPSAFTAREDWNQAERVKHLADLGRYMSAGGRSLVDVARRAKTFREFENLERIALDDARKGATKQGAIVETVFLDVAGRECHTYEGASIVPWARKFMAPGTRFKLRSPSDIAHDNSKLVEVPAGHHAEIVKDTPAWAAPAPPPPAPSVFAKLAHAFAGKPTATVPAASDPAQA